MIEAASPNEAVTRAQAPTIAALLWVVGSPRAWIETITVLAQIESVTEILVGFQTPADREELNLNYKKVAYLDETDLAVAARRLLETNASQFLFVSAPARPPLSAFDLACEWMNDDPRIATMSFLSNCAGYLSFPHRNTQTEFVVDGHDETTLTHRLRNGGRENARPVPLPVAEGAMILANRSLLEVCGELNDSGTGSLPFAMAEISIRGAKRGFNSYLDPFTFIAMPYDGFGPFRGVLSNSDARHALHRRYSFFPAAYDAARERPNSVLAQALDSARAKATGLRVLVDGSALGPKEMGTQLLILHLSKALTALPEIQYLALGVPTPHDLPAYARELRDNSKIRLISAGNLDFPESPFVDIIHRPFQPTGPIPWDRWRAIGKRSIITIQDLIAYRNGAYFENWGAWDGYRDNLHRQVAHCDAVISISRDVVFSIKEERLAIDEQRLFVVENGADARSKEQPTRIPDAVLERGWAAAPFLFVLGATYAHKNRDLAMRVWLELRRRGFDHKLVLVGASVPHGSTRIEEALLRGEHFVDDILSLPEVGSEERNWLLAHTSLAVYLTSAEGFGQIPFEAARFGSPSLFVSFGPLRELIDDPTLPTGFEMDALVARATILLSDPARAHQSVRAVLKNLDQLTWAETARKCVNVYFDVLDRPARVIRE